MQTPQCRACLFLPQKNTVAAPRSPLAPSSPTDRSCKLYEHSHTYYFKLMIRFVATYAPVRCEGHIPAECIGRGLAS